ncbi:MAG TPA: hypothetical protein VFV95_12780 [Vicinamibacterales bacterium]|nr:hypothetical protein [Vicinamibacterales bacterium]
MSLKDAEFRVLRETIASRGTIRHLLLPATIVGWALISGVFLAFGEVSTATLISLAVLVAGFEAIHGLHVGVERIGRYLQVFYERSDGDGPSWESVAMRLGPGLPGAGVDPLFTLVFVAVTLVNLVLVAFPLRGTLFEGLVVTAHLAFLVRVVRARRAAAQQRAVDLETFTALRTEVPKSATHAAERL